MLRHSNDILNPRTLLIPALPQKLLLPYLLPLHCKRRLSPSPSVCPIVSFFAAQHFMEPPHYLASQMLV
jgi:hypothetical protein